MKHLMLFATAFAVVGVAGLVSEPAAAPTGSDCLYASLVVQDGQLVRLPFTVNGQVAYQQCVGGTLQPPFTAANVMAAVTPDTE